MPSVTQPDNGTGATITFATSEFTAQITDFDIPNSSRAAIDVTHLASSDMAYIPGDLVDAGSFTVNTLFNPDAVYPIKGAAETITIAFALRSGDTTASSWAFTGFVTDIGGAVPLEDRMTGSLTIKLTGAITKTVAT